MPRTLLLIRLPKPVSYSLNKWLPSYLAYNHAYMDHTFCCLRQPMMHQFSLCCKDIKTSTFQGQEATTLLLIYLTHSEEKKSSLIQQLSET